MMEAVPSPSMAGLSKQRAASLMAMPPERQQGLMGLVGVPSSLTKVRQICLTAFSPKITETSVGQFAWGNTQALLSQIVPLIRTKIHKALEGLSQSVFPMNHYRLQTTAAHSS
jgi:hypothetical protein